MTTRLDKTLKRELTLEGRTFILAVSPEGLKLTLKGKRNGQELRWSDLISGDAALATALNASIGSFAADQAAARAHRGAPRALTPPVEPGAGEPKSGPRKSGARKSEPPPRKAAAPGATSKRSPRAHKR